MPENTIKDFNGEILRFAGSTTTTPSTDTAIKPLDTDSTTVEIIISDLLPKLNSMFGHVALSFDDRVYSRAHEKYVVMDKYKYLAFQQVEAKRDSVGLVIRISANEKEKMISELEGRVAANKKYDIFSNSCSTNVADVLESVGILAHDPRYLSVAVTPKTLLTTTRHSKRLVKENFYQGWY